MSKAVFITSWPITLGQGSGTALFVSALKNAVQSAGTQVEMINPALDTGDYIAFTHERLWFNVQLARDPRPAAADWILGLDYDGFALPRKPVQRFIGTARAVFADLVETEPEPFRSMLRTQAYFEGHNLRLSDLVIVPSEYARRKVLAYYRVPEQRTHVIPNGIDLHEWDRLWSEAPDPAPDRRPTVLAVSKLYPRKKIDVLLKAIPHLIRRFPDVDVRIAGGGFEWDSLQRLTADLGVQDNMTWLGDIAERGRIVAEFKRCHVFTHPSIQDAFANVCLEAMASNKPLVVSDAAVMPELVRAAGSGLIVAPENPEALAAGLAELLADDDRRDRFGAAGRAFAETMTWEQTARRFMALVG